MNENETISFWNKLNIKTTIVILVIPFLVIGFFSHTNIRIQLINLDLTPITVELVGPLLVFYFLYSRAASGTWKEKLKQVLEALYLFKDKKHLKYAVENLVSIVLLSFSLILPIFFMQSNLLANFGYIVDNNMHDIIINYLIEFFKNIGLVTMWEEIVFRGYFLNYILRKSKIFKSQFCKRSLAIFISSIVFMTFHIFTLTPYSPEIRLWGVFLFGLFLGINLITNKNLLSNIVIHAVINVEITEISKIIQKISSGIMSIGVENFKKILNKIYECGFRNYNIDLKDCINSSLS